MSTIKLFMEFHYGVRRPNVTYKLNSELLTPITSELLKQFKYQDRYIITLEGETKDINYFDVIMEDKEDKDMLFENGVWIDHYVKVREMSVDGIYFETALYNCSGFRHSMSDEWVQKTNKEHNVEILPYYPNSNEVRLNGIWSINFTTPLWKWQIERKYK